MPQGGELRLLGKGQITLPDVLKIALGVCLNKQQREIHKWPEGVPEPFEVSKATRLICMSPDEFKDDKDISDLVHDMFWFPDDGYFIFSKSDEGIGAELNKSFESAGIEIKVSQRYFYPHPYPGYKNDYIQILPGPRKYDWQEEAVKKKEYARHTLGLLGWKKKDLDFSYAAEVVVKATKKPPPVLSAKPGLFGFSIDLIEICKKLKNRNNGTK